MPQHEGMFQHEGVPRPRMFQHAGMPRHAVIKGMSRRVSQPEHFFELHIWPFGHS